MPATLKRIGFMLICLAATLAAWYFASFSITLPLAFWLVDDLPLPHLLMLIAIYAITLVATFAMGVLSLRSRPHMDRISFVLIQLFSPFYIIMVPMLPGLLEAGSLSMDDLFVAFIQGWTSEMDAHGELLTWLILVAPILLLVTGLSGKLEAIYWPTRKPAKAGEPDADCQG